MDTDQDRLSGVVQLADQLMRFVLVVKRSMARFGGPNREGIEYPAYGLLAHLVTDGPQRTTALAEAVHADTSTVSRQTAALIRHGLVERRPDPVDGRASILAPTENGERAFQDNRQRHNENMARVVSGWSPDEVCHLATLLSRLNSDLESYQRGHDAGSRPPVAAGEMATDITGADVTPVDISPAAVSTSAQDIPHQGWDGRSGWEKR